MSVELKIGNVLTVIEGEIPQTVKTLISEACSYSVLGAEHSVYGQVVYCPKCKKLTKEPTTAAMYAAGYPTPGIKGFRLCQIHGWVKPISLWDGVNYLFTPSRQSFPTGLISRVTTILKANKIAYTLKDQRIAPPTYEIPWKGYKPRKYQSLAVESILKKTRGILHAATGTGKTLCIAWLIKKTCVNTLILTHTKSVFNQVCSSIASSLGVPVGQVGDGIVDIHKFTVSMPQSLTETVRVPRKSFKNGKWVQVMKKVQQIKPKFQQLLNNTEMLVVDEAHRLSASTCQLVANSCPNAYYRVGVSATPWRDDLLDILIEAATGRVAYKYTATQAIEDGYLARPTIHMVKFKQSRQPVTTTILVEDKKSGNKVPKTVKVDYNMLYDNCVVNNYNRNVLIARIAYKCYSAGKSVLIIVRRIEHGSNIYKLLEKLGPKVVRYVNGEDDPAYLQKTLDELDKKKFMICIATGIFSEGVDIKRLDCVINATAGDSSVNAMQIVGRALRKVVDDKGNDLKPTVDIYDIADTNIRWLAPHAVNRQLIYETEEGYIIKNEDEGEYL